jgi:hypothetical protein
MSKSGKSILDLKTIKKIRKTRSYNIVTIYGKENKNIKNANFQKK